MKTSTSGKNTVKSKKFFFEDIHNRTNINFVNFYFLSLMAMFKHQQRNRIEEC